MYQYGDIKVDKYFDNLESSTDYMGDYLFSYIYEVPEKRINRYKKKAEVECLHYLYESLPGINKNLSLYQILIELITTAILHPDDDSCVSYLFKMVHDYYISDDFLERNHETLLAMGDIFKEDANYIKLAEFHFENACKRFIARRSCSDNYNLSNFMQCLPKQDEDFLSILEDCLNGLWIDILRCLKDTLSTQKNNTHSFMSQLSAMEEKNKELQDQNAALYKKNDEYCTQIRYLKKDIEQMRNYSDNKYKNIIAELKRENDSYKKKIEAFSKKENPHTEEIIPKEKEEDTPYPEDMEVDTSLNYIFITDPEYRSSKRIEQTFPNSLITKETISYAQTKNVTAVIFLTKNLKHSYYYKSKDFCVDHNIPYIHCVSVNVDSIKEKMLHDLKDIVAVKKGGC